MQLTDTNPLSLVVALVISFIGLSVFAHDAQIDNAVVIALSTPSILADDFHSPVQLAYRTQHTHSDGGLLFGSASELRPADAVAQPLNKEDKKDIAKRRLTGNTFGSEYRWPSI